MKEQVIKPVSTKHIGQTQMSVAPAKRARRPARNTGKPKTLSQINQWMEANGDEVVKVVRQNTQRLTGKEVL